MLKTPLAAAVIVALPFCGGAQARDAFYADNFVSGEVGSASSSFDDSGSKTEDFSGTGYGFAARVTGRSGLMFDAKLEHASTSLGGEDFRYSQYDGAVGYQGDVGRRSSWYAAAVVSSLKLVDCFGSCIDTTRTGFGFKGGFVWPFARQWYGALQLAYLGYGANDGGDAFNRGSLSGSVGYKITPHLGLALNIDSNAYIDRHDSDTQITTGIFSVMLSYYF